MDTRQFEKASIYECVCGTGSGMGAKREMVRSDCDGKDDHCHEGLSLGFTLRTAATNISRANPKESDHSRLVHHFATHIALIVSVIMDSKSPSDTSTVDMTTKAPSYAGSKRSVSSSSTLVDVSPSVVKSKIPDSTIPESTAPVEDEDESEEEWMDGNDYPQFVNHDETWKTITVGDMKRCKLPPSPLQILLFIFCSKC